MATEIRLSRREQYDPDLGLPGPESERDRLVLRHLKMAVAAGLRWAARFHCDADDLIQAACLGLVVAADRWRDIGVHFATYARSEIHGRICEQLRQDRRRPPSLSAEELDRFWTIDGREEDGLLDRALARLPAMERDAILGIFVYGQTYPEAGVSIGLSEFAVRRRVKRGLKRLRNDPALAAREAS